MIPEKRISMDLAMALIGCFDAFGNLIRSSEIDEGEKRRMIAGTDELAKAVVNAICEHTAEDSR